MDIIMRVPDVSVRTPKVVCVAITRSYCVSRNRVSPNEELDRCMLHPLCVGWRLPDNLIDLLGERWQTERRKGTQIQCEPF